ncbi:MAG: DUF5329 family protein [Verrucomicrobiales bacterium]
MRLALYFVAFFSLVVGLLAREPREEARIEGIINAVEGLKGALFIRNGSDYDAKAAAGHLRLKLSRAGKRINTAEQFIEYCASRSSFTGEKYKIKLADGQVIEAAVFFKNKLKEIDERAK